MTRDVPYTPFIDAVIAASKGLNRPTGKMVTTRIVHQLWLDVAEFANTDLTAISARYPGNERVLRTQAVIEKAKILVSDPKGIRSWDDAWRWIDIVISNSTSLRPRGVDASLLYVQNYVRDMCSEPSGDILEALLELDE